MSETADSVLHFWFGESDSAAEVSAGKSQLWWRKDESVDRAIADRFGDTVESVAKGEFSHWHGSPAGQLASIICVDQLPRNFYRDQAQAFAYDDIAFDFAEQALSAQADLRLPPIRRVFMYLPFEHRENIAAQSRSVALFQTLADESGTADKPIFENFLDFAKRHYEVIEKFGRFPHRNRILGRPSTPRELEFLKQPGSSF